MLSGPQKYYFLLGNCLQNIIRRDINVRWKIMKTMNRNVWKCRSIKIQKHKKFENRLVYSYLIVEKKPFRCTEVGIEGIFCKFLIYFQHKLGVDVVRLCSVFFILH